LVPFGPTTSDEALWLAAKLAGDAGDYDRASSLLDMLKRTPKPVGPVVDLALRRVRK
jgi:hypothetical protein